MGPIRSYLVSLLLCVCVINEVRLPVVTCQDDEGNQCLPRKTFFALLRLPEVSSNLAAYSRTARIIQDAKNRDEIVNLKTTSSDDGDDIEICLPAGVYLDLFRIPSMPRHISSISRAQKTFEDSTGRSYDQEDPDLEDIDLAEEKRSIATLAKNGDFPITVQDRQEDDEEKRSLTSMSNEDSMDGDNLDALIDELYTEQKRNIAALARDYGLPNGKRNVATLARDFALPNGKRNIAALARDYGLPSGKRNIAALARDYMLPNGKRNIAALARDYMLPNGKRNIAALARDYALPNGKRYLGSLARNGNMLFQGHDGKRNVASLVRNGYAPVFAKRNIDGVAWSWRLPAQNRFGRSLDDGRTIFEQNRYGVGPEAGELGVSRDLQHLERSKAEEGDEKKLEALAMAGKGAKVSGDGGEGKEEHQGGGDSRGAATKTVSSGKRPKRQIDFSDEYPLPVMQNTNVLDYEEMMEALAEDLPNPKKRFMGRIPQMGPRPTTPPTRRLGR